MSRIAKSVSVLCSLYSCGLTRRCGGHVRQNRIGFPGRPATGQCQAERVVPILYVLFIPLGMHGDAWYVVHGFHSLSLSFPLPARREWRPCYPPRPPTLESRCPRGHQIARGVGIGWSMFWLCKTPYFVHGESKLSSTYNLEK